MAEVENSTINIKKRLQTEFHKSNSIEFVEIKNGFANY